MARGGNMGANAFISRIIGIGGCLLWFATSAGAGTLSETIYFTVDSTISTEECARALLKRPCKTEVVNQKIRAVPPLFDEPSCYVVEEYREVYPVKYQKDKKPKSKNRDEGGNVRQCTAENCSAAALKDFDLFRSFRQIERSRKFGVIERIYSTSSRGDGKHLDYIGTIVNGVQGGTNYYNMPTVVDRSRF